MPRSTRITMLTDIPIEAERLHNPILVYVDVEIDPGEDQTFESPGVAGEVSILAVRADYRGPNVMDNISDREMEWLHDLVMDHLEMEARYGDL